jgi:hypothetical protein
VNALEVSYSFDDLVRWGATRLLTEEQIRAWFGDRDRATVGETLEIRVLPNIIFWTIMRPELIEERVIHQLAVELAEHLLARLRAEGHYIDFRSERVLAKMREWIAGSATLGELSVVRARAARAREDVQDIDDSAVWLGARVAVEASDTDARDAFRNAFYSAIEHDMGKKHQLEILNRVKVRLKELSTPKSEYEY